MSKELNIGDYVRTKNKTFQPSQIAKIQNMEKDSGYNNQYYIELDHNLLINYNFYIYEEDIIKSSPNIIDLIEVGDIIINPLGEIIKPTSSDIDELKDYWKITKNPIKSIVTREILESIEYKIGE